MSKTKWWHVLLRPKYPALDFASNYFGGHVSALGVTIFGANAMHWAVNIRTRGGYLCFNLPIRCFGVWWPLYAYFSPNATPWAATRWLYGRRAFR